jgi:3-oxoacyl-[acyl-carrier protein] reductase
MGRLAGKVAIVTGAGRGIGAEIARTFAKEGADIVLAEIDDANAQKVAEEVRNLGQKALTVKTDVTRKAEISEMVERTLKEFGRVDILVNNAGTIRPVGFLETTEEDWDAIQNIDLKGLFLCTQAVAPHMIKRGYGRIVNVSSMASHGWYMPGYASYCAAKAAVNNLTKYSARELGEHGVTVNAVAPGEILTSLTYKDQVKEEVEEKLILSRSMTMTKRIGETRDVALLVLFLASDESSYITGEVISVDGGRIDKM